METIGTKAAIPGTLIEREEGEDGEDGEEKEKTRIKEKRIYFSFI